MRIKRKYQVWAPVLLTPLFDIEEACILQGSLPSRQLKFVLAWAELHKDELMQNWELAKENQSLNEIASLM